MNGIHKPKKSLVKNPQVKALFGSKSKETTKKSGEISSVPLARHEERDRGSCPCLLGEGLKDKFRAHALLQVTSTSVPDLRFFVRADPDNFREDVNGISISKAVAAGAKLNHTREVQLREVPEDEANLSKVEMVLLERSMSKRDLRHLHLTIIQNKGEILYRDFQSNLSRQHVPRCKIMQLMSADGEETCGRVSPNTDVVLRTASASMFVFVHLSSEIVEFCLAGRPMWHALLGCLQELIDRSLRTYSRSDSGDGHYVRLILFARAKAREGGRGHVSSNFGHGFNAEADSDLHMEPPSLHGPEESDGPGYRDHYEVFWEGVARSLPPTEFLLRRIVHMCTRLHEEKYCDNFGQRRSAHDVNDCMLGVRAKDLLEASRGNILECVDLALDHYDQHHMDRSLGVTGQKVVLITPGSGTIHASSRKLYERTHKRLSTAGPSSGNAFHMICLRQPSTTEMPWVTWPAETEDETISLPQKPPWIDLTYHKDCGWSPNYSPQDWVRSSFQPLEALEALAFDEPLYVPNTDDADKENSILFANHLLLNDDTPPKGNKSPSSSTRVDSTASSKTLPLARGSRLDNSDLRWTGEGLWHEIRLPVLRPCASLDEDLDVIACDSRLGPRDAATLGG